MYALSCTKLDIQKTSSEGIQNMISQNNKVVIIRGIFNFFEKILVGRKN